MLGTQVYGLAQAKQVGRRNFVGRASGAFRQALHKATALCVIAGLSVPALPAPEAHASAMALLGTLDISKTGAATYGLDISVPPGTGGMIPSLSLQYNSQAGNSTLGMGWSVAGLSGVSRCPKNLATDGERGAVNFDGDDRFCLEGQRLIVVSGTYGADGSEYRTEVEGFSRIYSHGTAGNGPAWFEVQTKSGQTMAYGNTVDSRALAQGTTTARVWAVNKIEDTVGNYLTYTYVNDTTNGQLYPTRIDYTANDAEGLSAYNSVRFSYEVRPDIVPLYLGGSLMKSTTRLTNVKTYVGEAVVADYQMAYEQSPATGRSRLTDLDLCTGAGACLPGIDFEYSGITFTSGTTDNGTLHLNPSSTDGTAGNSVIYPVELNGDGKTDIILAPSSGNTVTTLTSVATADVNSNIFSMSSSAQILLQGYKPFFGDYNGDGFTDTLLVSRSDLANFFVGDNFDEQYAQAGLNGCVLRINGQDGSFTSKGGGENVSWGDNETSVCPYHFPHAASYTPGGSGISNNPDHEPEYSSLDINGDGLLDIFYSTVGTSIAADGGVVISVDNGVSSYLFDGEKAFEETLFASLFSPYGKTAAGDFNGDGLSDVFWVGYDLLVQDNGDGTYTEVSLSNPVVENTHTVWLTKAGGGYDAIGRLGDDQYQDAIPLLSDFNGDGLTDIFWSHDDYRDLWFSRGDGSFVIVEDLQGVDDTFVDYKASVGDFNGDGLADVFFNNEDNDHRVLWVSKGDGTFSIIDDFGDFNEGGTENTSNLNDDLGDYVLITEFNGDGKADILFADWNSNGRLSGDRALWLSDNEVPDLLIKVTSGLGPITELVYLPLTDSRVYTKDTDATYPLIDIQSASQVIYQVDADNGASGIHSVAYHYAGAKGTYDGRGWLGFREVSIEDLDNNIVQTTTYSQTYPLTGMTLSQTKTLNGQVLNSSVNTYESTNLGVDSTRYFIGLASSVVESWDLDGSSVPPTTTSYVYDDYGNATTVTVSTPDGANRVTSNIYINDTINWYLGRLTSASVSSTLDMTMPVVTASSVQALDDVLNTDEDQPVVVQPLSNDVGSGLTITNVFQPGNGVVVLSGTDITYTPFANFTGLDSFTYTIEGAAQEGASATVSVNITPINDAPVAVDDAATVFENIEATLMPLDNDSDVDGDILTITAVSAAANGAVSIAADSLSLLYTSNASYLGAEILTYTVSDGNGESATATLTLNVVDQPTPLVLAADNVTLDEDASASIMPLSNDTGDTLGVTAVTQGTHGAVTITSTTEVLYVPTTNYNGADSFNYTVTDEWGNTAVQTVSVSVTSINDAPVAVADVATTDQDVALVISPLGNDTDVENDTLLISLVTAPSNGTAVVDTGDLTITYTPTTGYAGSDSFSYTVSDGNGGTASANVSVTIEPVATPMLLSSDTLHLNEDTTVNAYPLSNDLGDGLMITSVTQATHGSVVLTSATEVNYTPDANFNGADSFSYSVTDSYGDIDTSTVSIVVAGVNDAPVGVADSISTDQDMNVTVSPLVNDSDIDGDALIISAVTSPTNGTATIDTGSTSITYTPASGYTGSDSFSYTVSDGNGGTDTANIAVTVNSLIVVVRNAAGDVQAPYTDQDTDFFFLIIDPGLGSAIYASRTGGYCNGNADYIHLDYHFTGNGCEFVYSP